MKKYILPVLAISMLVAMPIFGAEPPYTMATSTLELWTILPKALNWFFNIIVIIGIMFIISAGYRYITAGGDETKVKAAMNNLIYALVGIAIALFAKGLIYMITQFLGQPISL